MSTRMLLFGYTMLFRIVSQPQQSVCSICMNLVISPMAKLEIQYLHEIGRFRFDANEVCRELAHSVGLRISQLSFADIADAVLAIDWMRDPFDRLIVAEAAIGDYPLITGDRHIRQNYLHAIW